MGPRYKCDLCINCHLCAGCYYNSPHAAHRAIVYPHERRMAFRPEEFVWVEELGSGWFGTVSKVVHLDTGTPYALKRIDLEKGNPHAKRVKSLATSF
jgi:hypothetical protein